MTSLIQYLEEQILPRVAQDLRRVYDDPVHQFGERNGVLCGACPWHDSKSKRSFQVTAGGGWHCWGCRVGGGPVQYRARLREIKGPVRGSEFVSVVLELAQLLGIPLPTHDYQPSPDQIEAAAAEEERRLAIAAVGRVCLDLLWIDAEDAKAARGYLGSRGLMEDHARDLGLGYYLTVQAVRDLLTPEEQVLAERTGLLSPAWEGYLIFPWADALGRPLTLYGRYAGKPPRGRKKTLAARGEGSKRSPLYFDRARRAGHRALVAVEGILDAAVLQARGESSVVAYVAGGFGQAQVETLRTYGVQHVTIVPDPDSGGEKGTESSIRLLAAAGIPTFVAPRLPDGQDPDEFVIARGIEAWREHVAAAQPAALWRTERALAGITRESPESDKRAAVQRVSEIVRELSGPQAPLDRESIVDLVKEATGYAKADLRKTLPEPGSSTTAAAGGSAPEPDSRGRDLQYVYRPDGLYWTAPDPDARPLKLANLYSVEIESIREVDDGLEQARGFQLSVGVIGQPPYRLVVPIDKFSAMEWIFQVPGATPEPGKFVRDRLRHAIQVLSGLPLVNRVYGHLGWARLPAGQNVFLFAGGAVGAAGYLPLEVEVPPSLAKYQLLLPRSLDEFRASIRASLQFISVAPMQITLPLYAAVWRAPLGETDFSIMVVGTTGAGKSCLTGLAQQHYGACMGYDGLPAGWHSTANALEGFAFAAKDVLFTVDDFAPARSGSRHDADRAHGSFDRLIRAQGNRQGRARMTASASLSATRYPRGLIVTSGEEPPRGASCLARVLTLPLRRSDLDLARLTACQGDAGAGLYAMAMAAYLQWLAPRMDQVRQALPGLIAQERANFQRGDLHGRSAGIAANLMIGMRSFARFAFETGAITQQSCDQILHDARGALWAALEHQAASQAEADPVATFFALLSAAVSSGLGHFVGPKGVVPDDPVCSPFAWGWRSAGEGQGKTPEGTGDAECEWRSRGELLGYVVPSTGDLYLIPPTAVRVAAETSQGAWSESEKALGNMLRERALLRSTKGPNSNRSRPPAHVVGGRPYVWHLGVATFLGQPGGPLPQPQPASPQPFHQQPQAPQGAVSPTARNGGHQ
ncbi:MAG: toprim domain-containing protein [Planctomycetota bacterium]